MMLSKILKLEKKNYYKHWLVSKNYDTKFHPNGKLMYSGSMKTHCLPDGKCIMYNIEGKIIYNGEWKDGLRHGTGTSFNQDDSISFCGEWESSASSPDGSGT